MEKYEKLLKRDTYYRKSKDRGFWHYDDLTLKYLRKIRLYRYRREINRFSSNLNVFPLSQKLGIHITFLEKKMSIDSFAKKVENAIGWFEYGMETGLVYSRRIVDAIVAQLERMMNSIEKEGSKDQKEGLPVYNLLYIYMKEQYVPIEDDGLWALPGQEKDAIYRERLKYHADCDLPPAKLHDLGMIEMNKTIKAIVLLFLGRHIDRAYHIIVDVIKKQFSVDYIHSKAEVSSLIQKYVDMWYDILPLYFYEDMIPPKESVSVKEMTKLKQIGAVSGSYQSSTRTFNYNMHNLSRKSLITLKTLVAHEVIPGHYLERYNCIERYDDDINESFCSFKEGWALYAESLIDDGKHVEYVVSKREEKDLRKIIEKRLEVLKNDVRLPILLSDLLRCVRLVIETGLNSNDIRMTTKEASEIMTAVLPEPDIVIQSEISRYLAHPGRSCCYKLGKMRIVWWRDAIKEKLGTRFNIKQFHDDVLSIPFPISIMEEYLSELYNIPY